ncbi:hypothetical protein LPJGGPFB_03169 [Ensifer adhaerens]|uniref:hypothetical protein n=1 Tax=Ensifer adhaerens TaxID=106592 RepID=UPI0015685961|nr:hypothetical protein [Ensifer adhaerens]NRP19911.1 hypothetical protein [Ensifer adhaerens]
MNAWATTMISGLVFVVAYLQWRTAHQKVVLDLFDRRLAIYEKLRQSMRIINQTGKVSDEADRLLLEAESEAAFLFGPDIQEYFRDLWMLYVQSRLITRDNGYLSQDAVEQSRKLMKTVGEFYNSGHYRFGRYMRMDQMLVPTPLEWLVERNRQRLSYADEHQR